ncbi:hypothetical protein ITP53_09920 [Nonomuraea sp. K274]|uniref:Uncharacterized protein n=1 Tax=Nonomuraea cypriaca TaxID=1187855 RepID=A0A931A4D5_9ACTN|nr:hypothetical protein [Nonomuraea cypriaca]MBF8186056.1 hypothetical protein [Nonomuraea cypriaca]
MTHVAAAARNNADWCDMMCRAHGSPGTFGGQAWTSTGRTPLYYPDAVTLTPEATVDDVLGHIDAGPGASVKDSFATLDLPDFDVLFEAQWIYHPAPRSLADTDVAWEVVGDAATLREWEQACFGGEVTDLFLPKLLDEAVVLAGRIGGDIICGSVLNASDQVAGISNVYAVDTLIDAAWSGSLTMAAKLFPGRPLAGYETDPEPAVAHGFTTIGPLRVWLRS